MSELDSELRLILAEVVNIALGHAAGPLSQLVDEHVILSVPEVELFPVESIPDRLEKILGQEARIHLVGQTFRPRLRGECWFVLNDPEHHLAERVLEGSSPNPGEDRGLVLELANIVVGACIGKISEVLGTETSFSPPVLHLYHAPLEQIRSLLQVDLEAILVRTTFRFEGVEAFDGILLIMLPTANLSWLADALAAFLSP